MLVPAPEPSDKPDAPAASPWVSDAGWVALRAGIALVPFVGGFIDELLAYPERRRGERRHEAVLAMLAVLQTRAATLEDAVQRLQARLGVDPAAGELLEVGLASAGTSGNEAAARSIGVAMGHAIGEDLIDPRWLAAIRLLGDLDPDAARLVAAAATSVPADESFDREDAARLSGWEEPHLSMTLVSLIRQGFLSAPLDGHYTPTRLARAVAVLPGIAEHRVPLVRTGGCDAVGIEFLTAATRLADTWEQFESDDLDRWWAERGSTLEQMDAALSYLEHRGLLRLRRRLGRAAPRGATVTDDGVLLERAATFADVATVKAGFAAWLSASDAVERSVSVATMVTESGLPVPLVLALVRQLAGRGLLRFEAEGLPSGGFVHQVAPRVGELAGWT